MKEKIFEYKKEYDKKPEYDFAIESELTVTITLSEYRKLVTSDACKQQEISRARSAKWEAEEEADRLKAEVLKLKEKLYGLQKQEEQERPQV